MNDPPQRTPDLRASDAEREHAVEILGHAATEGRLSVDELDERIQSAYATHTVRELDRLVAGRKPSRSERRRARELRSSERRRELDA
jgi:Domain of unknown function (DUF1707)